MTLMLRPYPYQAYSPDAFKLASKGHPAYGASEIDRGCPLETGIDPPMWQANGTTGEGK
jgi:hypothetical protein